MQLHTITLLAHAKLCICVFWFFVCLTNLICCISLSMQLQTITLLAHAKLCIYVFCFFVCLTNLICYIYLSLQLHTITLLAHAILCIFVIPKRGATHTPCRNGTLICRLRLTGHNKSYLREQQMDWEWAVIPVIKEGDASQDIQFQSYHAIFLDDNDLQGKTFIINLTDIVFAVMKILTMMRKMMENLLRRVSRSGYNHLYPHQGDDDDEGELRGSVDV